MRTRMSFDVIAGRCDESLFRMHRCCKDMGRHGYASAARRGVEVGPERVISCKSMHPLFWIRTRLISVLLLVTDTSFPQWLNTLEVRSQPRLRWSHVHPEGDLSESFYGENDQHLYTRIFWTMYYQYLLLLARGE